MRRRPARHLGALLSLALPPTGAPMIAPSQCAVQDGPSALRVQENDAVGDQRSAGGSVTTSGADDDQHSPCGGRGAADQEQRPKPVCSASV